MATYEDLDAVAVAIRALRESIVRSECEAGLSLFAQHHLTRALAALTQAEADIELANLHQARELSAMRSR